MQPEASESLPETPSPTQLSPTSSPSHHGLPHDQQPDPLSPSHEDQSGTDERSGSEWSLSASPSASPAELDETRLNLLELITSGRILAFDDNHDVANKSEGQKSNPRVVASARSKKPKGDKAPLLEMPEELLFHVISHLPAHDLLTVKLVSRRFYSLVNSPHAWMHAFSKFFSGPDAMRATADTGPTSADVDLRSTKRFFTRLTPSPKTSWTVEYLLRTRLLRCISRGRPAVPCANPAPGRPGKGMATFTFNSRLTTSVSNLHAAFGDVLDKRKPQFIHGSLKGSITSSDKKGKFDSWGTSVGLPFVRHYADLYPESSMWGKGNGDVAGCENSMDVSQPFGMVYGEGLPGGFACFWPTGQKHLMFLPTSLDTWSHAFGIPKLFPEKSSVCSVWIAKTTAIPKMTQSLIGIMVGSSNGVLSTYSLGSPGNQIQRQSRGQLSARFALSPGVPIIAIAADDNYSEERHHQGRIWAVALNALGEVFYLKDLPQQVPLVNESEETLERDREAQAWQTGRTVYWNMVNQSERVARQFADFSGDYLPMSIRQRLPCDDTPTTLRNLEFWLSKSPNDVIGDFDGWDMRRWLTVDFGADDGKSSGEAIVVADRSSTDGQSASIRRYRRSMLRLNLGSNETLTPETQLAPEQGPGSLFGRPVSSFGQIKVSGEQENTQIQSPHSNRIVDEWRSSSLVFGRYRNVVVQTTAIDLSQFALTTTFEDDYSRSQALARGQTPKEHATDDYDATKFPGQRARFFAVGTGAGTVFVWNVRAAASNATGVVNEIGPIRVIHTQSPSITSLALTSLYIVHGGSEGLVQAWDPLASTLEPVRTLTSRNTLNTRRRAVIASQQNPFAAQDPNAYAATAICLDPNPTVLRGIVAIGNYLRYWSFSSAAIADDSAKSQKKRLKRANRGLTAASPGGDYISGRRAGLKGLVNEEMASRALEEKQRKVDEKRDRVVAKRFGLDLLGEDASEEELLAYAKLLSEEDHQRKLSLPHQSGGGLRRDATEDEVEAYKSTLTDEERQEWKFASWDRRFDMPVSDAGSTPKVASTPTRPSTATEDDELAQAIQMSLGNESTSPSTSSISAGPAMRTPIQQSGVGQDDDIARAIQLSLQDQSQGSSVPTSPPSSYAGRASSAVSPVASALGEHSEDSDIAEAIRRSLQVEGSSIDSNRESPADNDEFPVLPSTPGRSSHGGNGKGAQKGKGKERNAW